MPQAGASLSLALICCAAATAVLLAAPAQAPGAILSEQTVCKQGNRLAQLRVVSRVRILDNPPRLRVITRFFDGGTKGSASGTYPIDAGTRITVRVRDLDNPSTTHTVSWGLG
jgi:hypothetical protein